MNAPGKIPPRTALAVALAIRALAVALAIMLVTIGTSIYAQATNIQPIASLGKDSFPSGLIQGSDGFLYGTTPFREGTGNVFRVALQGGEPEVIHQFDSSLEGLEPNGGLVQAADGNFYGVLAYGSTVHESAIYQMTPEGKVTILYQFAENGYEGGCVSGGLKLGKDGKLYGAGYCGGTNGNGTIFSLTLAGEINVLHRFQGADGRQPLSPPTQMTDGTLIGSAGYGGATAYGGTIFQISATGAFKVVYAFPDSSSPGSIIRGSDGNFYGVASNGGYNGRVFKMTPEGNVTVVKQFSDGSYPRGDLIEAGDGFVYGVTRNNFSGSAGEGSVFRFNFAGDLTTLHTLAGLPWGSLIQGSDHNLYGTLQDGTIFKVTLFPSRLANISTRGLVLTGDSVMIGGFIISGSGPKRVMLRAIGPSLSAHNISNAVADPTLEIHANGGELIASNDNWQSTKIGGIITASQSADIQNSGLAPLVPAEGAIIATLPPGAYTAIVRGTNGTTGVGLVEGYDLDQASDSKFVNISTRGFVQTGDNVMIGGFIVRGTNKTTVLLRAIGPSLKSAGVPNVLEDPILELYSDGGILIVSNDNWRSDQEAKIINSKIPPLNDAESAIVVSLAPGAYTAIVRGKNLTTGVALVEAYTIE